MLELNRLREMPKDYDPQLFNSLYSKTESLRKKLASQINCHRFGLQYEDILSMFDIKFIFVFNKFYNESENKLTAMMVNSLKNFKCRILRKAYTREYSQIIVQADDMGLENSLVEEQKEDLYRDKLLGFLKEHLSDNAYMVLEAKLYPPPYILNKINKDTDSKLKKIPDDVILDYFNLGSSLRAHKYLASLKKEIATTLNKAKEYFKYC